MIIVRKLSFWLAVIGLFFAGSLVMRLRADLTEPVQPPPVAPATKPFGSGIAASGLVEAENENTSVGVPLSGLVTAVHVHVWDRVVAGQPLLQLDDRELQAALLTQRATIEVAAATLAKALAPLARIKALHQTGVASDDDFDSRRNDVAIAEAQLRAAEAVAQQTEAMISRLTLRAPIAGTILQVNIRPGEFAHALSGSPVLVLGNIDRMQVRADVDEQIAPRVRAGKRAVGYLKGDTTRPINLDFVRIEPFIIPKRSLTGASIERVDTRVLQIIYRFAVDPDRPVYVGQQLDLYIEP
jgi:HlyD family secretion protein